MSDSDDQMNWAVAARAVVFNKALGKATDAWFEQFRDVPGFDPERELCFNLAAMLALYLASYPAGDPLHEQLRQMVQRAGDDALAITPPMPSDDDHNHRGEP